MEPHTDAEPCPVCCVSACDQFLVPCGHRICYACALAVYVHERWRNTGSRCILCGECVEGCVTLSLPYPAAAGSDAVLPPQTHFASSTSNLDPDRELEPEDWVNNPHLRLRRSARWPFSPPPTANASSPPFPSTAAVQEEDISIPEFRFADVFGPPVSSDESRGADEYCGRPEPPPPVAGLDHRYRRNVRAPVDSNGGGIHILVTGNRACGKSRLVARWVREIGPAAAQSILCSPTADMEAPSNPHIQNAPYAGMFMPEFVHQHHENVVEALLRRQSQLQERGATLHANSRILLVCDECWSRWNDPLVRNLAGRRWYGVTLLTTSQYPTDVARSAGIVGRLDALAIGTFNMERQYQTLYDTFVRARFDQIQPHVSFPLTYDTFANLLRAMPRYRFLVVVYSGARRPGLYWAQSPAPLPQRTPQHRIVEP